MTSESIYISFNGQRSGIGIVDCLTGQTETLMLPGGYGVCAMDVCLADELLVCGTVEGYGRLYSVSDSHEPAELPHLYVGRPVVGVAAYPEFKIVTLDDNGRGISWRLGTEICFKILPQKQPLQMIVKLPGTMLAGVGENTVHFWDIATEELIGHLSLPQGIFPADSVFWPQYDLLVIAGQLGLYAVDINDSSCRQMPGYPSGSWRLFIDSGNLYPLETHSGILYRSQGPQQEPQQTMLCRGLTDAAMAADKIFVIDEDSCAFQYAVSDNDIRYAGKLPWDQCHILSTAAEFERAGCQQKTKAVQMDRIRQEFDRAVGEGNTQQARQLIGQLSELGCEQDAERLRLQLAESNGDIAEEINLLCRLIKNCSPEKLDHSVAQHYLDLLVQSCQLAQALDICDQFNIGGFQWLRDISDTIDDGDYIVDSVMPLSQLLDIYKQLDVPFNGTFVLNRGKAEMMQAVKITANELSDKLTEITSARSMQQTTAEMLEIRWISGCEVAASTTLTFSALEVSETCILIPSLRFVNHSSATVIEPVTLLSACCKSSDILRHNERCLESLERLEQSKGEEFWPDHLSEIISEALTRLKFKNQATRKLGGLYE
ncbi:MAG: hypothetical protein DRP56_00695 [Planctomycetota bacterium]|nr:MAG: hypothetical protein DRP56_00695 [Planctomycetota bacterium]